MRYGIAVTNEPSGMEKERYIYTTTKRKLQVALLRQPPHMDILTFDKVGTAWTADDVEHKETLWPVLHGLPFVPRIQMYFYVQDAPAGGVVIGSYTGSSLILSSAPARTEYVYYEVDAKELRIVHYYKGLSGMGNAPANLNQHKIRVKYMVQSINRYIGRSILGGNEDPA